MITWPPQPHRTEGQPQGPEVEISFYRIVEGLSDVSLGSSFLALFYFTAVSPKNDLGEFLRKCTFLASIPEILIWRLWLGASNLHSVTATPGGLQCRCSEAIRGPKANPVFPSPPFPLKTTKRRHTRDMTLCSCIHSHTKNHSIQ